MFVFPKISNKLTTHTGQIRRVQHSLGQINNTTEAPPRSYGQPTPQTHPHLVTKGHVIPNISADELATRRERLSQLVIDAMKKKHSDINSHMIVIPSASKSYMSEKIPYIFRQNTDFLYLSGCQEPDTCLVINVNPEKSRHRSTLFMRERDPHSEIWDGPRTDPSEAVQLFGVDEALPVKEFPHFLDKRGKERQTSLWYDLTQTPQDVVVTAVKDYLVKNKGKVWDSPKGLIHKIRLIKSKNEIDLMQKSCDIAAEAIATCMSKTNVGVNEHHLFATMDYECRMRGAEFLAYPPVIAGGNRATIIHYVNNNQLVRDGEMVLMDAGCEYHGYSSDITRTWPANGKFSQEQRALYDVVLSVQLAIIQMLVKRPSLDKLFEEMCLLLGRGLQEIGLTQRTTSIQTTIKDAYEFCPHHVSHYLGMDVHDTAMINRNIPVQPGMIITVEPGIYINHLMKVPKEFQGIGIRIEDDVLITEDEPIVLSSRCPKHPNDIEALIMAQRGNNQ